MLITSSPIRDSLWNDGLWQDEELMVRGPSRAYINEELFCEYFFEVLIPYVTTLSSYRELQSETALLLMDSAFPHLSALVLQIFGQNNLLAITFPAHTTTYSRRWTLYSLVSFQSEL
jgi:hypothetical protein